MTVSYKKSRAFLTLVVVFILAVTAYLSLPGDKIISQSTTKKPSPTKVIKSDRPSQKPGSYSVDEASSLWAVVNKGRVLLANYTPTDLVNPGLPSAPGTSVITLRQSAATALKALFSAAASSGVNLATVSGYRSYAYQVSVYDGYVRHQGRAAADTFSARPGHSEHQTGLAADLGNRSGACTLDQCFANLSEGRWLAANAHKYGFIIRYPKGQQTLTGYIYEPWHVRYVGTELSNQIYQTRKTLEQYFNLPVYQTYPNQSFTLKM